MKKYLSIFLILFAIMATETGCETNNPEEGTREEVENLSLIGKTYVWESTEFDEILQQDVWVAWVHRFMAGGVLLDYGTRNKDLSSDNPEIQEMIETFKNDGNGTLYPLMLSEYVLEYPYIYIGKNKNTRYTFDGTDAYSNQYTGRTYRIVK